MSTIFFLRHGQASFGKDNYDELSETGVRQSKLLARYLAEKKGCFDAVYTGTLERQRKTADELLKLLGEKGEQVPEVCRMEGLDEYPTENIFRALGPIAVEANPSLKEHIGRLMTDRRSFQKVFEALMSMWASGRYDQSGLVSWNDFTAGVNRAIDEILARDGAGKNVAVFTSGGSISVAVRRTLNLSNDDTMRVAEQIVNSSITRFKSTTDRIMLFTFNEYPHLERENDEKLITYR
ncbi:MAG: histidine phosphatase family protein [Spirochaetes bacterium]|nr:histidine phosphatase family protein [Spirochaetota bacterium]